MALALHFAAAIKDALKARGRTYAWLAARLSLSEASVKRLLSRGGISLERLDAICEALELDGNDLLDLARDREDGVRELTLEQEQSLAEDSTSLVVFYMLLNGLSQERIARECGLAEATLTGALARLDRLKLITLLPGNRVRLRLGKDHTWRPNGPLRRRYREQALRDFVSSPFAAEGEYLRFEVGLLGQSGLDQLKKRIDRLAQEFNQLADLEGRTPADAAKRRITLALAFRPWDFARIAHAVRQTPEQTAIVSNLTLKSPRHTRG